MEDFFDILSSSAEADGTRVFTLMVNKEHQIFKGHFPGKPIVPGVTTLMMARLCAQKALGKGSLRYQTVKDAKYVAPIVPDGKPIRISLAMTGMDIKATVSTEEGSPLTTIRGTLVEE